MASTMLLLTPMPVIMTIALSGSIPMDEITGTNKIIMFGWMPGTRPARTPSAMPTARKSNISIIKTVDCAS